MTNTIGNAAINSAENVALNPLIVQIDARMRDVPVVAETIGKTGQEEDKIIVSIDHRANGHIPRQNEVGRQ